MTEFIKSVGQSSNAPLAGITVLDFGHVLAGPFAGMMLADYGATVIKVEKPGRGDTTRATPPFSNDVSTYFATANRNKFGIAIDQKTEEGKALLAQLAAKCDVLIHNFRPGVMERLGLGYEELSAVNPRLVYCAISGFGQDSPLREKPAFDPIIQAMSGLMAINGEPGGRPTRAGLAIADVSGGLFSVIGILLALHGRQTTGKGRFVDVSMFDALFNMLADHVPAVHATGKLPPRSGAPHTAAVPLGTYDTADGHIVISAFTQGFWTNLCRAVEREVWLADERFARIRNRQANNAALTSEMNEVLRTKTTQQWCEIFDRHDVPYGPVLDLKELMTHPQVVQRRLLAPLLGPGNGGAMGAARPIKFNGYDADIRKGPPGLGEDTDAVLGSILGIGSADLARLRQSGVIG